MVISRQTERPGERQDACSARSHSPSWAPSSPPLLLLPLLTPALVASAEATAGLFEDPPALAPVWVGVLAAFDTIFLAVTWLFGEYLLEE